MEINCIYNEDCLETMKRMPDDFVDLVVTSPPYDSLREYNGYKFDFENIAKSLYRVAKPGGIVVWIVADEKINGSKTGTSFKQALYFKEIGFKLNDTMIWEKGSFTAVGALVNQYAPTSEFMFVFTKGKLKTFNPIKDRPNKWAGTKNHAKVRQKDGTVREGSGYGKLYNDFGIRFNVWNIPPEKRPGGYKGHPAVFPEQLAGDHIISWSNENDLVYDPLCGSGTTCRMAKKLGRNYLGSEISSSYCDIARSLLI